MSSRMYKLRLRFHGTVYKFLGFDFRDHADGSFVVVFNHIARTERMVWNTLADSDPKIEAPSSETFKITYHTTGQINFHGVTAKAMYWQPTYNLTEEIDIAYISVPSVELLTKTEERHGDYIIGLPDDLAGRTTFVLSMLSRCTIRASRSPADSRAMARLSNRVRASPEFGVSIALLVLKLSNRCECFPNRNLGRKQTPHHRRIFRHEEVLKSSVLDLSLTGE